MKIKIFLILLLMPLFVSCAKTYENFSPNRQKPELRDLLNKNKPMTYDQLSAVNVKNYQCKDIDSVINQMESQLKMKGLQHANPEDLNDEDRKYNARARIVIWSMRIGCNNPNRYAK